MASHSVSTVFNKNMAFTANINGHDIVMDTTVKGGGDDSGASPKQLMLASLAGCTGMDVVSVLAKMKVAFTDFSMDVVAGLTEEHPMIYNQVKLTYKIKVAEADQSKVEKAVNLSQEKYCGVSAMFRAFADLKTEIVYLP
ncbi:MAG: OsmC family protein [Chitinophagaceae bacterium]|nr:OsmC family protein [Chitinophagaceae bacterium]